MPTDGLIYGRNGFWQQERKRSERRKSDLATTGVSSIAPEKPSHPEDLFLNSLGITVTLKDNGKKKAGRDGDSAVIFHQHQDEVSSQVASKAEVRGGARRYKRIFGTALSATKLEEEGGARSREVVATSEAFAKNAERFGLGSYQSPRYRCPLPPDHPDPEYRKKWNMGLLSGRLRPKDATLGGTEVEQATLEEDGEQERFVAATRPATAVVTGEKLSLPLSQSLPSGRSRPQTAGSLSARPSSSSAANAAATKGKHNMYEPLSSREKCASSVPPSAIRGYLMPHSIPKRELRANGGRNSADSGSSSARSSLRGNAPSSLSMNSQQGNRTALISARSAFKDWRATVDVESCDYQSIANLLLSKLAEMQEATKDIPLPNVLRTVIAFDIADKFATSLDATSARLLREILSEIFSAIFVEEREASGNTSKYNDAKGKAEESAIDKRSARGTVIAQNSSIRSLKDMLGKRGWKLRDLQECFQLTPFFSLTGEGTSASNQRERAIAALIQAHKGLSLSVATRLVKAAHQMLLKMAFELLRANTIASRDCRYLEMIAMHQRRVMDVHYSKSTALIAWKLYYFIEKSKRYKMIAEDRAEELERSKNADQEFETGHQAGLEEGLRQAKRMEMAKKEAEERMIKAETRLESVRKEIALSEKATEFTRELSESEGSLFALFPAGALALEEMVAAGEKLDVFKLCGIPLPKGEDLDEREWAVEDDTGAEYFLLSWANCVLKRARVPYRLTNFKSAVADGFALYHVVKHIFADLMTEAEKSEADNAYARASAVAKLVERLGIEEYFTPAHIINGDRTRVICAVYTIFLSYTEKEDSVTKESRVRPQGPLKAMLEKIVELKGKIGDLSAKKQLTFDYLTAMRLELEVSFSSKRHPVNAEAFQKAKEALTRLKWKLIANERHDNEEEPQAATAVEYARFTNINRKRVADLFDSGGFAWSELECIRRLLEQHFVQLMKIFRFYSQGRTMDSYQFLEFAKTCKIPSKECSTAKLDLIFIKASIGSIRSGEESVADRELEPHEWVETLLRTSVLVYPTVEKLCDRFRYLIELKVLVYAQRVEPDAFRASVGRADVARLFRAHRPYLHKIFYSYARLHLPGNPNTIDRDEFVTLMKDCKLIDNHFTTKDIFHIFANVQYDEEQGEDGGPNSILELIYPEFLESICAIAYYKVPNPFISLGEKLTIMLSETLYPNAIRRGRVEFNLQEALSAGREAQAKIEEELTRKKEEVEKVFSRVTEDTPSTPTEGIFKDERVHDTFPQILESYGSY